MATTKSDLLNFRMFEDDQGVHLLLSGSLAGDFQTLVNSCKEYCCCRFGKKSA